MKLLTIKELSKLIKVKESTIYSWVGQGLIPCHKLNGLLRFDSEEIEEWIKNSKVMPIKINKLKSKNIKEKDIDFIVKKAIESVRNRL